MRVVSAARGWQTASAMSAAQQDQITSIAVVGPGLMGSGIALELAARGYDVRLYGRSQERLEHALRTMRGNVPLLEVVGGMALLDNIRYGTDLANLVSDVDLVIEAIAEDLGTKQQLFSNLDSLCAQRTILASTTSTFVPSALAGATRRPDRVLVTHYFNPPYLLPLVEVVPGQASNDTVEVVCALFRRLGKHPALV